MTLLTCVLLVLGFAAYLYVVWETDMIARACEAWARLRRRVRYPWRREPFSATMRRRMRR